MSLALNYSLQRIDRDIPSFHKELLTVWYRYKDLHMRTESPESVTDIFNEPLFLNPAITTADKPLIFTDWVSAGITRIRDICYEVIPGFLPMSAIHDFLTEDTARTVSRTTEEWKELLVALPSQWCKKICTASVRPPPTLQPCFGIVDSSPAQTPIDISLCRTRHFYAHLLKAEKPVIPAVDQWKQKLQPEPSFNAKQWKTLYPPLINNKQGDVNWKVAHRVLPTALSLNKMDVYATPYCHRCGFIDTLEHAVLDCNAVNNFWNQIQKYVYKITDRTLTLTPQVKIFGKVMTENDTLTPRTLDLVNWTLTLAGWAIYKSAVNYRTKNLIYGPEALFKALVRSHLRFQYKLYKLRETQYYFPFHWCLGQAFAKVENDTLIFTL